MSTKIDLFSILKFGKQVRNIAYLGYIHTLLTLAEEAELTKAGTPVVIANEESINNDLHKLKDLFNTNGWTYEVLDERAPPALRKVYNSFGQLVHKYFKANEDMYIPSYLALLLLVKIKHWKVTDIDVGAMALEFTKTMPGWNNQEKTRYAKLASDIYKRINNEI